MDFTDKVAVITGGARGIGAAIAKAFKVAGAKVAIIDILENDYFVGDIANPETLEAFHKRVIGDFGHVDYLINNAMPLFKGIGECTYEQFNYALQVGVSAPFYLTKLFLDDFSKDGAVVNISSSRDRMSQPQSESYTAAKGGISALTRSLAVSLGGKVRVNSVSPGWIDTRNQEHVGPDALQHPVKRVGKPEDIVNAVMFLCSKESGFITGEDICVDGGMTKLMIYHDDFGWSYNDND